jgi:phage shock protein PspC (stress-responsive transcriptional regulator)
MNKTVNINLGGIFFHIDEDAYAKLTRYFDAIKRSLSKSSGQEEILKDIEIRVSELLTEKQKSEKHVVGLKDVDEVITVMGQPEDYIIDEEGSENKGTNFANTGTSNQFKKLYRDRDSGVVGGVLAGLGHYFGIDKVWLRVILLVLFFAYGTGLLLYIILWIVMPEAITTSEKLEMTGEPVNISNIEKKVREEFEGFSDKLKGSSEKIGDDVRNFSDKYGDKINSQARNIGSSLGDLIITLLGVFSKFIGGLLVVSGVGLIIALFVTLFAVGPTTFMGVAWLDYFNSFNYTQTSIVFIGILFFFVFGIPCFLITLLGLKIIIPGLKSIGNIAKYTLLAVWLIAIAILVTLGVNSASEVAYNGKTVNRETINIIPTDTLFVKFRSNDYYAKHNEVVGTFRIVEDSVSHKFLFSNDISIEVLKTDEKLPYIQIEKSANGKSSLEARKRAEKINFRYKIQGNHLVFDNYFLTDLENKFRGQQIEIYLYLPEGTLLKPDASMEDYDESNNDFFNMHYSSDSYVYKVGDNKVKCLNCPPNETDEYNDGNEDNEGFNVDIDTDTEEGSKYKSAKIKINKNGISITADSTANDENDNSKGLKIDKNGIIIKTK